MAEIVRYIKHRRDTAANWASNNPVLKAGQIGIESDTLTTSTPKFKIGDGTTAWNTLPYFYGGAASYQNLNNVLTVGNTTGGQKIIVSAADYIQYTDATASTVAVYDSNKRFTSSVVTTTELGYVSGVTSAIQTQINAKQATLVSGTNIKTVNSYSLLGAGNVALTTSDIAEGTNLYFTNARGIAATLTGYVSGAGTVAATDTILQAIQKLNGNTAAISGAYVTTVNGASGAISNVAVTTGTLAQFASTTSAQLAGIISDETGSGALVFGTSPQFTTSISVNGAAFGTISPIMVTAATATRDGGWNTTIEMQSTVSAPYPFLVFGNQSGTSRYGGFGWNESASGDTASKQIANIQAYSSSTVGQLVFKINAVVSTNTVENAVVFNGRDVTFGSGGNSNTYKFLAGTNAYGVYMAGQVGTVAQPAIYLAQSTPSSTNYALSGSASDTNLNSATNLWLNVANGGQWKMTSTKVGTTLDHYFGDVSTSPSARIHAVKTTEQLRLGYDASNRLSFTIASAGQTTLSGAGTTQTFKFNLSSIVMANAALATSATDGFTYIPTCAGAPSGVPTTQTGTVAMIYDTTNNNFYIYNGAWKKVALT